MKTDYLKNISNGVHFFDKAGWMGVCNFTKNVFLSKYFSGFSFRFVVIYQNFAIFQESLFPPKKLVVVANRCKVFKIFIPTKIIYTRFRSLAAIINFRRMIFCGRASWTLNSRNIAMFSFRKRWKMENLSAYLQQFLDGLFRQ